MTPIGRQAALTPNQLEILSTLYRLHLPATVAASLLNTSNITIGKYYAAYKIAKVSKFDINDIVSLIGAPNAI